MLLAGIGLFGLTSYGVSHCTQEIGVRIALGARKGQIVRLVMSDAAWMLALGAIIGIGVSWGATRLIASLLYGVGPGEPLVIAASTIVLALTAFLGGRERRVRGPCETRGPSL